MKLISLGEYIEQNIEVNSEKIYKKKDVMGMTIDKKIIPTKADIKDSELPKFIIVNELDFIYNPRTHGKRIGLGFNDLNRKFIISWNNIAFHIKKEKLNELDPYYLYMFFNRKEWDRMACFDAWGSSTEVFSWDSLCEMKMYLPSIEIQKKYVSIYKSLVSNLYCQSSNNDDLKLICDSILEEYKNKYPKEKLGKYIFRTDERNSDNKIKKVYGVSTFKEFREPTSKVNKDELSSYKIVHPREISFVQTTHNEKVFANAINEFGEDIVVTSVNEVFHTDEDHILPEYLVMFFARTEFDRYARFNSWGSARETFTWNDLEEVMISIPTIDEQIRAIKIFNVYKNRKKNSTNIINIINSICPILISGSLKEANNE